jgi:alpha-glucosidase
MSEATNLWWRDGVIYQIYPRSFQDSNGDGVGDLRGILSRLDYLVKLGVDAAWVSPFYPSPMADFGYDVANYTDVDPLFGTLADFDALIAAMHQRGLRLILDFVPNHTSNQHPWFLESRTSRCNPKRDWYLWRDGSVDGGPPNNWMSNFGGPGWTFDQTTGQYYYHSFLAEQPDLNWRNPEVRTAMYAAMRFWLDRGVDGFRMDVLWLLIKDDQFRDNPPNPDFRGGSSLWSVLPVYTADQPETQTIVQEMRALLDEYSARVLIGEIYLPIEALVKYYGACAEGQGAEGQGAEGPTPHLLGAQMPFNFHLIQTGWQAQLIAGLIRQYEAALPAGAWPNWVLGNHDQKRLASRIGVAQARVAAVLLLTLRGTPTLYYGDELGMPDARIAPEQVVDPAEKNQPGIGQGRDPERSPMLWENRENAGFTSPGAATWLPLVWDWPGFTVETEEADAGTMLKLYRRLLELRRARPELHGGAISEVIAADGVLSYLRSSGAGRIQVFLNMSGQERWMECGPGRLLLSSFLDREHPVVGGTIHLRRDEAVVILSG